MLLSEDSGQQDVVRGGNDKDGSSKVVFSPPPGKEKDEGIGKGCSRGGEGRQ